eukprot:TRINITY_DN5814_c0_g1_i1.p1 TRINITY_DN5814_c0_g1~~TRINITY_DN5814_c0_g1_i1.p1  ORF type:complete len:129 (+),score=41.85 TRINITY_DN5814_c0_g1_i1:74-460(+)
MLAFRRSLKTLGVLNISIKAAATPNPQCLKFDCDETLNINNDGFEYKVAESESAPSIVQSIFNLNGIDTVFVGQKFITVTKDHGASWQTLKPDIFDILLDGLSTVQPESTAEVVSEVVSEDSDLAEKN